MAYKGCSNEEDNWEYCVTCINNFGDERCREYRKNTNAKVGKREWE